MDPESVLQAASEHLSHDREECGGLLAIYFEWRLRGGFEPPRGDERAFELIRKLGRVADTLAEALSYRPKERA